MAIARLLLLLALCIFPVALANTSSAAAGRPFHIQGRVYCDTCRAGFETSATTYISGAKVRLECKDRKSLHVKYAVEAVTDANGKYNVVVEGDKDDQICESVLVSSPIADCKTSDPGRSKATALLTRTNNGVVNDFHIVNAMGFFKDQPLTLCANLLKKYLPLNSPF